MTREQAMQRGHRLYGDKFRYWVERGLSSPEKRAAAQGQLDAVRAQLKPLLAQARKLRAQEAALESATRYYRFQVLECLSANRSMPLNMIRGKGDTWEEAFASIVTAAPTAHPAPEGVTATGGVR